MTKSVRALAALVLAATAVPLVGVSPAFAETSTEQATNGAYFYRSGIDQPEQVPVGQVPNLTGSHLDGVAPQHLAVAVDNTGQEDKRSFLGFDLAGVPAGATINKATLTVPLAENGNGNRQVNVDPALVQACPADDTGFSGEDGSNLRFAPGALCDVSKAPAATTPDGKAFVFDITTMANAWLNEANNGLALIFANAGTAFQVVFLPPENATLDVDYTEPEPATETAPVLPDVPVSSDADTSAFEPSADSGTADLGGGFESFDSFDAGSASTTGGDSGGFASADAPVISGALPAPATSGAEPAVAPDVAPAPVAARRIGAVSEVLDPTASFFVAGLLLAGVLALLSLIMGDPKATSAVTGTRQSRLSQALQARQRAVRA
jgi:hypothetical protein